MIEFNDLLLCYNQLRNTDTSTERGVIIDEQRGPAQGEPGDQAEGPGDNNQQSSNGQASHRGLIPRARVKVTHHKSALDSLNIFVYSMQVLNLSLAYAITFLASNVPYVTFELIIALDKQDNMGPIMAALFGNMYITIHK